MKYRIVAPEPPHSMSEGILSSFAKPGNCARQCAGSCGIATDASQVVPRLLLYRGLSFRLGLGSQLVEELPERHVLELEVLPNKVQVWCVSDTDAHLDSLTRRAPTPRAPGTTSTARDLCRDQLLITHGSAVVEGPARKSAGEGRCIRRTGWEDMAPSSTDSGTPGRSLTFNFFSTSSCVQHGGQLLVRVPGHRRGRRADARGPHRAEPGGHTPHVGY